jgi:hypothetical protein
MRILAIERGVEGKTAEDFEPHLEAETRRVWELYTKDVIREIYFRADERSAVVLLECEGIEEAEEHLSTLPLVRGEVIRFDLIPLVPYPGFERLFRPT